MRKLTREECELVEMYLGAGDRGTMSAVKRAQLPLGKFPGLEYDDLISVGRIALCEAAMQWDWREGDFGSFAFFRCHFRTIDWIRTYGPVFRSRGGVQGDARETVQTVPWMYTLPNGDEVSKESKMRREDMAMSEEGKYERSSWLFSMLRHLSDREKLVMHRYYAEGYSDQEIAQELEIHQSRAHQLRSKSLFKLRKLAHEGVIDVFSS